LPEAITEKADAALRPLMGALSPDAKVLDMLTSVVLGLETKVANYFSVDAMENSIVLGF